MRGRVRGEDTGSDTTLHALGSRGTLLIVLQSERSIINTCIVLCMPLFESTGSYVTLMMNAGGTFVRQFFQAVVASSPGTRAAADDSEGGNNK